MVELFKGSESSAYAPTLTPQLGITSASVVGVKFVEAGNDVFVSGQITIDPSAASIELLMELPTITILTNTYTLNGTSVSRAGDSLTIEGNIATNEAIFRSFNVSDLAERNFSFNFHYSK